LCGLARGLYPGIESSWGKERSKSGIRDVEQKLIYSNKKKREKEGRRSVTIISTAVTRDDYFTTIITTTQDGVR